MAFRKKFKSRHKSLVGSSAATLSPAARSPLIPVAPNFPVPVPKYSIGEEVLAVWESDGELKYTHALVIGMAFNPTGHKPGWSYLPRWVDNIECPKSNGKDDGVLWHESHLKPMPK
ncbi:MAG TPA: hypothetical protein V6D09_17080 [Leptolyngbyaceae cyanobacterium]